MKLNFVSKVKQWIKKQPNVTNKNFHVVGLDNAFKPSAESGAKSLLRAEQKKKAVEWSPGRALSEDNALQNMESFAYIKAKTGADYSVAHKFLDLSPKSKIAVMQQFVSKIKGFDAVLGLGKTAENSSGMSPT